MDEGLPHTSSGDYPHHMYGDDTNWNHIQDHVNAYPEAWAGFEPHLSNQKINTQVLSPLDHPEEYSANPYTNLNSTEEVLINPNTLINYSSLQSNPFMDESTIIPATPELNKKTLLKKVLGSLSLHTTVKPSADYGPDMEISAWNDGSYSSISQQKGRGKTYKAGEVPAITWLKPSEGSHFTDDNVPIDEIGQHEADLKWDQSFRAEEDTTTEHAVVQDEAQLYQEKNPDKPERRTGSWIMRAPKFSEQLKDTSRTAPITYITNTRMSLGTLTERGSNETLSEYESINKLADFLGEVSARQKTRDSKIALRAQSMLENMTFIGKKEYDTATAGIADIWRQRLSENPSLQLCPIAGKMSSGYVKSDSYLLDNILRKFTDEDIATFGERIITDPGDLTAEPEDVAIIMLDDWTISGQQLAAASAQMLRSFPEYKRSFEVQLIVATEERVAQGLNSWLEDIWNDTNINLPVSAYYVAHTTSRLYAKYSSAHITGAHCAVDYDFNDEIATMAYAISKDMPPATNIVRPYRQTGVVLTQKTRLPRNRRKMAGDTEQSLQSSDTYEDET